MFCRNCGKEIDVNAVVCMGCGCNPKQGCKHCPNCGVEVTPAQVVCIKCGSPLRSNSSSPFGSLGDGKNKLVAGVLAILFGSLGVHKFYLGKMTAGIVMLVVTIIGSLVTFGLGALVMEAIGLIEGIIYLTKSDDDFARTYVEGQKSWF